MKESFKLDNDGLRVVLDAPLGAWARRVDAAMLPLASQLLADCEASGVATSAAEFVIANSLIAAWADDVAHLAGLPPRLPFPLDLRLSAGLGRKGTTVSVRWLRVGTSIALSAPIQFRGLAAEYRGEPYRLGEPHWAVLRLVDDFNRQPDDVNGQLELWTQIRNKLGDDLTAGLSDSFLRNLRIVSADAFTLNFSLDASGHPNIVPRLMRRRPDPAGHGDPGGIGTPEGDLVLVPLEDELFGSRLDALADGRTVFPLRDGTYISVTSRLAAQLKAVRDLRKGSPEQRKQFVLNPAGILREVLGGAGEELDVSLDYIETDSYSDRVTNLAKWVPPILPWVKIPPIDWRGDSQREVGFRIGDKDVPLAPEQVKAAIEKVRAAMAAGHDQAVIADGVQVPATVGTLKSLEQLDKALAEPGEKAPAAEREGKVDKVVLVIETNFEDQDFCRTRVAPRGGVPGLPFCLATAAKPHQETGLQWLQEHWRQGSKGCLLADDMGLGKTYQALAFLAWVREQMRDGAVPERPLLVVAPVGLLANWEKEQSLHLRHDGIGTPLRAYGPWVKALRRGSHADGTAVLDTIELGRAPWVLASYEVVSDYQLSFGAVDFAVVVFDEAQKIKSPSTGMTSAAKALNADFVVAMTGTPVENRLADLWCIADTCQPGALKDLKSFSQRFEANPEKERLMRLRSLLWQAEERVGQAEPLMMLRRLKAEKLKGLPAKHEHVIRKPMPNRQSETYARALALSNIRGPEGTLGLIQSLRQISLHPGLFDGDGFDPEASARFVGMIEVLDAVHRRGEKALVFIESLEIQAANQLPLLLQRRYGLPATPMVINGQVGTSERQKRVDAFQEGAAGFDVMLLSPKAGGVGLTLTAANHVIHLSRWWNPAVEDQCSDRAYRIGQSRDVHIYYPMAIAPEEPERSFDLKLNELMARKRDLSRTMLMPMEFGKQDYEDLMTGLGLAR